MRLAAALVAALLALLATPAAAQTFPAFTGLVVDAANVIPADREAALAARLGALQRDTGRQVVVATIPDMQGRDLADYGYKLGRAWGVGLKGLNNGAILFIAPNEPPGRRGPRIEVGYGLEGVLTDALSSVVINTRMMPRLTAGDVPGALDAGADALVAQLRLPDDQAKAKLAAAVAEYDRSHRRGRSGGGIPSSLILGGLVLGFVILTMMRGGGGDGGGGGGRGRRFRSGLGPVILWGPGFGGGGGSGSGWGGFGGGSGGDGGWMGGGFGGGGGGSFGGGGASGSW